MMPPGGPEAEDASAQPAGPAAAAAMPRPNAGYMLRHPARWLAFGFGSGLSHWAPGTVGTLWAWVAFLVLDRWLGDRAWALLLVASFFVGWWACTRTARELGIGDPGSIVWDEVVAFWLVLWLIMPTGWVGQAVAFGLFRLFDAAKPGPVGWADRRFKPVPGRPIGWREGFGILFDDLVAALCTLLPIALWRAWWP